MRAERLNIVLALTSQNSKPLAKTSLQEDPVLQTLVFTFKITPAKLMTYKQRKLQTNGNPQENNLHFIDSRTPPEKVFRDS